MPGREVFGSILCDAPLITIGKRSHFHGQPLGLAGLVQPGEADAPALHLVHLAWSHEAPEAATAVADDCAAHLAKAPRDLVLIVANSEPEYRALVQAGLQTIRSTLLHFVDEDRFVPTPPAEGIDFDAVYVAGLEPYKRHELARDIDRLSLLYWRPDAPALARALNLLPNAHFANHEVGNGQHVLIGNQDYCRALCRAATGLCLSETEGPMRASVEYALCGLPVVSTQASGGRLELLHPDYSRIVDSDAGEVARAVTDLGAAQIPPDQIRAETQVALSKLRTEYCAAVNEAARGLFGASCPEIGWTALKSSGLWRTRPLAELIGDEAAALLSRPG